MKIDQTTLQGLAEESASRLGLAGGQVAIWDGENLTQAAVGVANASIPEPVHLDTIFQMGSTTKLYAAALTLLLQDEGLLDLDTPVKHYLPDFQLPDSRATETVTLRHLHSMSSGIDNGPYTDIGRNDDVVARYVEGLKDIPIVFQPGEGYGYSNASTTVAGRVAEVVTGQIWEEALQQRFLEKAGLRDTMSLPEDLVYRRVALGHSKGEEGWQIIRPWRLTRSLAPAGSTLCATAADLIRFARIFLSGGKSEDGTQILSERAVEIMHTPVVETPTKLLAQWWCVGTYAKRWDGHMVHGHSGTNRSGSSMLLWVPDANVAIATIANVPPLGYPFCYDLSAKIFPEAFGISIPTPAAPDPSLRLDMSRYVGLYDAHGVEYELKEDEGQLQLTIRSGNASSSGPSQQTTRLLPLEKDRFLPADVAASGGRGWDVAFVGDDGSGRATHYINGVFASKRRSDG